MSRSFCVTLGMTSAVLLCLPADAGANGVYTHVYVARLAMDRVQDPTLRTLLQEPRHRLVVEAGAMMPDSRNGHLVSWYHWETFVASYVQLFRERFVTPWSPEATDHALFLLGAAIHGLTDPHYDSLLLERASALDPGGGLSVDVLADYFTVRDLGANLDTPVRWRDELGGFLPVDMLVAAHALDVEQPSPFVDRQIPNQAVDEAVFRAAMDQSAAAVTVQGGLALAGGYEAAWEGWPWLGTYVGDPRVPGSVPWTADLAARYVDVLFKRLQGTDVPDRDMILGAFPPDGAVNVPITDDDTLAFRNLGVTTAYGILTRQVGDFVRLVDAEGQVVPTFVDAPYDRETRAQDKVHNNHILRPMEPLEYDSVYTIEVLPGFMSISGEVTTTTWRSSFRTRCADLSLDDCPPLDPPLLADVPPWERPEPQDTALVDTDAAEEVEESPDVQTDDVACGCGLGASPSGFAGGLSLLAWGLRRRAQHVAGGNDQDAS